jgi:hypothetical protein
MNQNDQSPVNESPEPVSLAPLLEALAELSHELTKALTEMQGGNNQ